MTEMALVAIAFLCQINSGGVWSAGAVADAQKKCHAYYASCISEGGKNLVVCMRERP